MVDISLRQIAFSLMSLISGAGIVTIFPQLPSFLVELFDSHLGRITVLVMLLIQAGQPVHVSVIMATIFYLVVILLKRLERAQQLQTKQLQTKMQQQSPKA